MTGLSNDLKPVPINIVAEFGITLYSRWSRRANGATLVVVRRTCGESLDMCDSIEVLDLQNEVTTPVHPATWIQWIKDGKISKIFKR